MAAFFDAQPDTLHVKVRRVEHNKEQTDGELSLLGFGHEPAVLVG